MKMLCQFANGTMLEQDINAPVVPDVFCWRTPEGATFYFQIIDELPSEKVFCREITSEQARKMVSEEL